MLWDYGVKIQKTYSTIIQKNSRHMNIYFIKFLVEDMWQACQRNIMVQNQLFKLKIH